MFAAIFYKDLLCNIPGASRHLIQNVDLKKKECEPELNLVNVVSLSHKDRGQNTAECPEAVLHFSL